MVNIFCFILLLLYFTLYVNSYNQPLIVSPKSLELVLHDSALIEYNFRFIL